MLVVVIMHDPKQTLMKSRALLFSSFRKPFACCNLVLEEEWLHDYIFYTHIYPKYWKKTHLTYNLKLLQPLGSGKYSQASSHVRWPNAKQTNVLRTTLSSPAGNLKCFEDYLCPRHQGSASFPLTRTEMLLKTFDYLPSNHLMRLLAREYFIETHVTSLKSSMNTGLTTKSIRTFNTLKMTEGRTLLCRCTVVAVISHLLLNILS